ncbi:HAD family hydrolase [Streptomyces sp. NBC_00053]|uniref:HAD family hydrolase n=1 Tax=unclassified Streptomyces TaxID=2593676 RepID=UPI0022572168|nr:MULTISPECIES: HAD family hydrolase [unclassified Streptomyces]MCX5501149.1 HAD family hydrolase [Streptomyces sp. NBC_00052]MCX5550316.1 HAD family hydrolase [Streptomyces sp. NBC_00051]
MFTAPELVIFDCDGVLVDSERIAVRIEVQIGAELGWPLTADEVIEKFVGRSNKSISELVDARLPGKSAAWQERYETLHREAVDRELVAVEGIHEALAAIALPTHRELVAVEGIHEALAAIALPTCVASSGSHEKMRHTLGHTGLYAHFEGRIFSATEVEHGKPAPDLFLHAARRMGVEPAACAVVEDSKYGVQAARSAGMRAFGFAGGLTPAHWLEGPDTVVFDDMRKLPSLLSGS